MAETNPFAAIDFTKFMADFKLPAFDLPMFDVDKLMASQRKNLEAVASANKLVAESVQTVFQRNAEIMRENVEELTSLVQSMSETGEPKAKAAHQADLTKGAYQRAVTNLKAINDTVAKTNDKVFNILNKRVVESLDEARGLVENGAAAATGKK
jgi:phasin family protein